MMTTLMLLNEVSCPQGCELGRDQVSVDIHATGDSRSGPFHLGDQTPLRQTYDPTKSVSG